MVAQMIDSGKICTAPWDDLRFTVAWMPTSELPAFDRIPDPPEGWRFVDKEKDARHDQAKFWDEETKHWGLVNPHLSHWLSTHTYIVPIDPPKPQYRPFANAAEFAPYRDKWWRYKSITATHYYPPVFFGDKGHGNQHWQDSFENKVFEDGTPFGIRID